MKKQLLIAIISISLVCCLFFFGKTTTSNKSIQPAKMGPVSTFDITQLIDNQKKTLSASQKSKLLSIENFSKEPSADDLYTLAAYWKDSIHSMEAYSFYISKASKLENSEKSLTFAAQLFLNLLRGEENAKKLEWETNEAIDLFQKAIAINPNNDDLRIGLGSCYIFGKGRNGNPQETMQGILEVLSVVRKDSNNMKAQLVLGIGGFVSGQYDKAVARLEKVISKEPGNLEAVAFLADTYAAKGDNNNALKYYELSKRLANDPHYSKEVDDRIKELKIR